MAEKKPLDWLVKTNEFLEKLPEGVLKYFYAFSNMGENLAQSYVDIVCRHAAWRVNITVERLRQRVLKTLNNQYGFILKIISTINIGKQVASNPLGAIGSFFSTITKPLSMALYFITTLATELPKLARNFSNIMAVLPPEPPSPHINYDAFQLKIQTVSMDALLSADSLPDPEVLFPEPEKPWSTRAFQDSFESASEKASEETGNEKLLYVPKYKKYIDSDTSSDKIV